jgi:NNP family nitrate/nitrite transporter-like MFS transporter
VIIIAASILRVLGGWMADKVGGVRILFVLGATIVGLTLAAATMPASPWVMVVILVACFSAMGAGNGSVFQLVPLRFRNSTAVAGSLIGEVGALAGGFLPNAMGLGRQYTGSFAPGFLCGAALSLCLLVALAAVSRRWTTTWVGEGGRAHPATHGHHGHQDLAAERLGVPSTT